jgi:hypothetical protein
MTNWQVTWQACFGAISAARVDAIEHYIGAKIEGGLKSGELDEAVESLATAWDAKQMGNSPGIGLLILTIKNQRKRARGIDTSEPYEITQRKRAVTSMPVDGLMRWNAVCDTDEDYRHRVIDACMRSGGFVIPYWAKGRGIRCTKELSKDESGPEIGDAIGNAVQSMAMPF